MGLDSAAWKAPKLGRGTFELDGKVGDVWVLAHARWLHTDMYFGAVAHKSQSLRFRFLYQFALQARQVV